MDIEKVVAEEFAKIVETDFIRDQIKEQLEKTVKESIINSIRSYSDFGKELDKKVKEALKLGSMDISLPEYNQFVCTWVMEIVNRQIVDIGKAQIEANLKEFFQPLEKSEWKISEIIEKFKKGMEDDGESGEITFIAEPSNSCKGYVHYYFDSDSGKERYRCEYQLDINENGVYAAKIKDEKTEEMKMPTLFGFDSFMFQLFATKAKIIDDSDSVETGYGDY